MKKIATSLLIVLAASVSLFAHAQSAPQQSADLTFSCTAPSERTDGTPLAATEIAHYRLYEVSHTGARGAQVAAWSDCGGQLVAVTGTRRYVMTVVDKQGLESAASNAVLVTTSRPKAPGGLQVRVEFKVTP